MFVVWLHFMAPHRERTRNVNGRTGTRALVVRTGFPRNPATGPKRFLAGAQIGCVNSAVWRGAKFCAAQEVCRRRRRRRTCERDRRAKRARDHFE